MPPVSADPPAGDDVTVPSEAGPACTAQAQAPSPPPAVVVGSFESSVGAGERALADANFSARYQQRSILASGGMGEVRLCHDNRLGRDVAMKLIQKERGFQDEARVRFLREARIQGQLEHPAVVPVYDLGLSPDGEIFFTMKRIRGVSLKEALDRLRSGDSQAASSYSRHRLLTVFSTVCLAVDFAHRRGVLHRDLKPSDITSLENRLSRFPAPSESAGKFFLSAFTGAAASAISLTFVDKPASSFSKNAFPVSGYRKEIQAASGWLGC